MKEKRRPLSERKVSVATRRRGRRSATSTATTSRKPSERTRASGHFTTRTTVTTVSGARYRTTVSADGDPGYAATAVMLAAAGLALACDDLPPAAGVLTPATGIGLPLVGRLRSAGFRIGVDRIGVHFHDTYGQALSNTLVALRRGVTVVDSSAGGLGGCPYAESATGNLATEDLVWALHGAGVHTGVDLAELAHTSAWMAAQLGRPAPSRVVTALAGDLPTAAPA